jgi:DNA-binding response OmpR family regulator
MTDDTSVLVVDDEEEVADSYADAIERQYDVTTAYSGEEALEKYGPAIDIVLLDRRMPEMSGDEVLTELRDRDHDCRIVMVTAVDPDVDIIDMDFDEYLVKPVTPEQLDETIETVLLRDELLDQMHMMFSLSSRLATLESKLDYEQLQDSDEYDALCAEFDELRNEVTLPETEDDPYFEATLEKLEALIQGRRN